MEGDINAYSEGWKYFTLIVPAASWKDTTFTIRFYDNIGDLYIDGLQLTRNDVQTKKYNSEGKVVTKYTALKSTSSTYDSYDRLKTQTAPAGAKSTYTYSKTNDIIKVAASIGPDSHMTYDKYGNVLTASIAGQVICTNEYAANNGSHITSIYPDGTQTGTTYDEYGKITSNSLDGNTITRYVYDNDGNIAKKTDALANVTTKYDYNDSNMLVRSEVYDGDTTSSEALESRMQYTYTKSGQVGTLSYQEAGDDIRTYSYTYGEYKRQADYYLLNIAIMLRFLT